MNESSTTLVTIKGVKIEAPTYRDPETTQSIADTVTQTLHAIEEASDRIDTHRFALEACMKIATELARERDRGKANDDELGVQLASVNKTVESLLKLIDQ